MSSFFLFLAKIFCRREVCIMAVVYATLIVKGKKTLEDVPALLKEQVREILSALDVQVQ
nr:CD1375 family protein [Anaerotruncus colihominis]